MTRDLTEFKRYFDALKPVDQRLVADVVEALCGKHGHGVEGARAVIRIAEHLSPQIKTELADILERTG